MLVFLAYAFNYDRELAANIEQLLASHDVRMITGEDLGGKEITPEVKEGIRKSDAVIALLTRREPFGTSGRWTTHDWVKYEINCARDMNKPAIALVGKGVDRSGPYSDCEYIEYDTESQPGIVKAYISLSKAIGRWKREIGRTIEVQILPSELASMFGYDRSDLKCQYRCALKDDYTEWKEARPINKTGGAFVYLRGIQDEHTIQIKVEGPTRWYSRATEQWIPIRLEEEAKS